MQQLCLTGAHAAALADRLFSALNVRPVGLRVSPFSVDGEVRGQALHMLPPPAPPLYNGVPCQVALGDGRSAIVPRVLEEVAAPTLIAALRMHAPVLLSGLSSELLACPVFRQAVRQCLASTQPVVVAADASAAPVLRSLVPPQGLICYTVPADEPGQAALLAELIPEAALRF